GADLYGDGSSTNDRPVGLSPTVGRANIDNDLAVINAFRISRGLVPIDASKLKLNPYVSLDARLTKSLKLRRAQRMELFFEAYNLTNYVTLAGVNGSLSSAAFLDRT